MTLFEKLEGKLKTRLREMGIATVFLMITTGASMILIVVPTWLNPNIYLKNLSWGSAILGSIMGQVVILIALTYTKKHSVKTILKGIEDLDDED